MRFEYSVQLTESHVVSNGYMMEKGSRPRPLLVLQAGAKVCSFSISRSEAVERAGLWVPVCAAAIAAAALLCIGQHPALKMKRQVG
jgi:hypothetical protein